MNTGSLAQSFRSHCAILSHPEVFKRCTRRTGRGRGLSFSIVGGTSGSDEFRWSGTPAGTDIQSPLPHNSRCYWKKATFLTAWVLTCPLGMLPMLLFFFFLIKIQLIYNVLPISTLQKSESVINTHTHTYIYLHFFLNILFHPGLSQETGSSFLCYSRTLFIRSKCNHVLQYRKWGNCPWKAENRGGTHPPPRVTHGESEWALLPCNVY